MNAVRTLRANLKLENRPCGWCQAPLKLGDDTAVCTTCEKEHHLGCWDTKAGCSKHGCPSAPLRRLDLASGDAPEQSFPTGAAQLGTLPPPGMIHCPKCGLSLPADAMLCTACNAITSPDGLYHGPKTNAPGAAKALWYGILGLFLIGFILGPKAIKSANAAHEAIARDPSLGGGGMATAGKVLGVIDIILFVVGLLYRFSAK